jgi:CHAP domain
VPHHVTSRLQVSPMEYPGRIIRSGEADGALVRRIKVQLNQVLGFAPRIDGRLDERSPLFGPQMVQAVKLFQARNVDADGRPLKQDGQIGAITWERLFGVGSVPAGSTPGSRFLERVISIAAREAAKPVREVPSNSNRGPEVEQYQRRADSHAGLAWCCSFVYWCFDEASHALSRPNPMVKTAGCLDHWQRAIDAGARRILRARAVGDPSRLAPGMIFIMDHGGGFGHTGIVAQVNGGLLSTIEGNTDASKTREGGGVYRLSRKVADINLGFIDYSAV